MVTQMRKRKRVPRRPVAAVTLLVGAGLVVAGSEVQDEHYVSSLLLQAGLTVLLVLPLLGLERLFEHRVAESEAQTTREVGSVARDVEAVSVQLADTRRTLADLKAETSGRLQSAADAEAALVEEARAGPSFENVRRLFQRADDLQAISDHGLRVAVPGQWERLRFRSLSAVSPVGVGGNTDPVIFLIVENPAGRSIGVQTIWSSDQTPSDALVAVADAWKRAASYPGDSAIDAEQIFRQLVDSFGTALESRRAGGDGQLSPLIEMLSSTWAMTDFGLEHVTAYYPIEAKELIAEDDLAHWRGHMADKAWVGEENEHARDAGEPDFWMVSELAHKFFVANQPKPT
jgi:hypothetical protein